jgi:tetratricopeptide (TPR) repeat protein
MSRKKNRKIKSVSGLTVSSGSASRWLTFIFFLLAFLLYLNTLKFDYVLDDSIYTLNNKFVQEGVSGFSNIVTKGTLYGYDGSNTADYRPVVLMNFALEKSIFGNSSTVNHFFNIFIYALLSVFLFKILLRIFRNYALYVPVCITALFIFHPLHTEVVANIKSRDEILCMLFGLMTLLWLFDYYDKNNLRYLVLSCCSFFLCLLSKENGFAYLGLIPLVLYFFSGAPIKKITLTIIPFLVIAGLVLGIRWMVLDSLFLNKELIPINNSLMAASNTGERLATCFTILLYALKLLIFPVTLSWDYSYNTFKVVGWNNLTAIISLLIHIGLLVIGIIGLKRKNIFSFAIFFYFIAYFMTSNLVFHIGSSFAERFLFTPSIAFCIAMPFVLSVIFRIDLKNPDWFEAKKILGILTIISILFIIKTIVRNGIWKDNLTLDASGILTAPDSARTHYAYADDFAKMISKSNSLEERKKFAKIALTEYQKSLDLYNKDSSHCSDVYYNMGMIRYYTGDTLPGISLIEKAISYNPKWVEPSYNLGVIFYSIKNYSSALRYLLNASDNDPKNADILGYIGLCYQEMKNYNASIPYYEKALQFKPSYTNIRLNLSKIYYELGDTAKALKYRCE